MHIDYSRDPLLNSGRKLQLRILSLHKLHLKHLINTMHINTVYIYLRPDFCLNGANLSLERNLLTHLNTSKQMNTIHIQYLFYSHIQCNAAPQIFDILKMNGIAYYNVTVHTIVFRSLEFTLSKEKPL